MRKLLEFWRSPWGHGVLAGLVLAVGAIVAVHQRRQMASVPLAAAPSSRPVSLPKVFQRDGQRLDLPVKPVVAPAERPAPLGSVPNLSSADKTAEHILPLSLFSAAPKPAPAPPAPSAPFGRLIPCRTVVTLESNRLDTPVIGLVTEDVWHDGKLVVPAGAEVHGRAALDRSRERIAASGPWMIVWRTRDRDNGTELRIEGLALDREDHGGTGAADDHDGSAGFRGEVLRTDNDRELKLFAAAFLASATGALQDTRSVAGPLGESALPAVNARNAALAGVTAILREQAQQLRDAIARDGFYLRVPAGKPFYLYVTQTLDRGLATHRPLSSP